ncbi:MAG: hypothetical protein J0M17_13470 [Planctomycetes bacterium]|nr:hypothetical protein [Planctomycetota bacterium]
MNAPLNAGRSHQVPAPTRKRGGTRSADHGAVNRKRVDRRGLSTMEVALATGIMLPFAAGLYFIGKEACGRLFQIIQSLVTWPFL